jgi:starch-binding outer membrane protein, SusD/RagB family
MKKIIFILVIASLASCKKDFLDTKPTDAIEVGQALGSMEDVVKNWDAQLAQMYGFAVEDLYGGHDNYGQKSWDVSNDLRGNDMVIHSRGYGWYNSEYQYTSWLSPSNNSRSDIVWARLYKMIKGCNVFIKYLKVLDAPEEQKAAIRGQAYCMRAYAYYYLANYYQQTYKGNESKPGVPLYTDVEILGTRNTVKAVYDLMIKDLTQAEKDLQDKTFANRTYMDIHVVQGFRARVALLMNDWATAATYAKKAYTGITLMDATQYRSGFASINNPEWIWGSQISAVNATYYASFFSHFDIKTNGYASLGQQKKITKELYDKIPVGDVRKTVFQQAAPLASTTNTYTAEITGYKTPSSASPVYNQIKFRVPTPGSWAADYVYMRAAEMYLIEAEGLAKSGNEAAARITLETLIKTRYPAYSASSFAGQSLVDEILWQRRVELWGEGFALIDIKRNNKGLQRPTGTGNHGAPNFDPIVYTLPDAAPVFLMRIPQRELDSNPDLTANDQNP